jgi:hypothetical protein
MIPPEARTPATACDADPRCMHAACFQVQLEASPPKQAHRQALACAHHVADVIGALRGWAREQDLADGQLTVLAIEPADGGREAGGTSGPNTAALREFAFTTLPLRTIPPSSTQHCEPAS